MRSAAFMVGFLHELEKLGAVKLTLRQSGSEYGGGKAKQPKGLVPSEVVIGRGYRRQHDKEFAKRTTSKALQALREGEDLDVKMTNRKRGMARGVKITREQAIRRLAKQEKKYGKGVEPKWEPVDWDKVQERQDRLMREARARRSAPAPPPKPKPRTEDPYGFGLSLGLHMVPHAPIDADKAKPRKRTPSEIRATIKRARQVRREGKKVAKDPQSAYD